MARKKKGKKITRSFGHVQQITITAPSKRMIVEYGNIDMGDPIQKSEFRDTDIELRGEQIDGLFTAGRKTHILFPPKTKCTAIIGERQMKCGVKGKKVQRRFKSDEEKRKRRRERRQRRKEERRKEQKKGGK